MWQALRVIRRLLVVLVLLVVAAGSMFGFILVAMRTKSPAMLRAVRRFNRAFTNKLQRSSAGTPGARTAVIRHRGRASGRSYDTPIVPFATDGGFLVSLPYGPDTDWVRNVVAQGSAVLVTDGRELAVDRPEILATEAVGDLFPAGERRTHRLFGVDRCLRLHLAGPADDPR